MLWQMKREEHLILKKMKIEEEYDDVPCFSTYVRPRHHRRQKHATESHLRRGGQRPRISPGSIPLEPGTWTTLIEVLGISSWEPSLSDQCACRSPLWRRNGRPQPPVNTSFDRVSSANNVQSDLDFICCNELNTESTRKFRANNLIVDSNATSPWSLLLFNMKR